MSGAGKDLWSVADVAAYLGVKPRTVTAYLARGQMPHADGKVGRSPWWWDRTIRAWRAGGNLDITDDCCAAHAVPGTPFFGRMYVCAECGNKRCPKATLCDNECTGSNEPGQQGSRYA